MQNQQNKSQWRIKKWPDPTLIGSKKILYPFWGHLPPFETKNCIKKHKNYKNSRCPKKGGSVPLHCNRALCLWLRILDWDVNWPILSKNWNLNLRQNLKVNFSEWCKNEVFWAWRIRKCPSKSLYWAKKLELDIISWI